MRSIHTHVSPQLFLPFSVVPFRCALSELERPTVHSGRGRPVKAAIPSLLQIIMLRTLNNLGSSPCEYDQKKGSSSGATLGAVTGCILLLGLPTRVSLKTCAAQAQLSVK